MSSENKHDKETFNKRHSGKMELMLFDFMLKSRNLFFLPVRQEATHLPHSCHSLSADLLSALGKFIQPKLLVARYLWNSEHNWVCAHELDLCPCATCNGKVYFSYDQQQKI